MRKYWLALSLLATLIVTYWLIVPIFQAPTLPENAISVPDEAAWVDYGQILTEGAEGEWDRFLYGGFAASAIKKDGVYYLYYQGADGYSEEYGTVTWRTIGLATSDDGLNFRKHAQNPLLTWAPHQYLEEGAVSSGVFLLEDEIYLVYGANTEEQDDLINADARLATAVDGVTFQDQGTILRYNDPQVWASGDELFPVIAFEDNNRYFIYYIPNGVVRRGQLGVAWGNALSTLQTARVTHRWQTVSAWGTGGYAKLTDDIYALFINNVRQQQTEVRLVSLTKPYQLSAPQQVYQFDDYTQATFLLDQETNTWFMYYRNGKADSYGVKLAPVGVPDKTPPTPPTNLAVAVECTSAQVTLGWTAAADADTGIAIYEIYQNEERIGRSKELEFTTDLSNTPQIFTVRAINFHNVTSTASTPLTLNTQELCNP